MPPNDIQHFTYENGLTLVVERMPYVQSAAFAILTPAGALYEQDGQSGTAAALCDLMTRGAGNRNSRELSAAFDQLGVQRNESSSLNFLSFGGSALAENIGSAIELYSTVILRPRLPETHFAPVISGIEQGLLAVEDDPQRKLLVELRRRCYDAPWNRPSDGDLAELDAITLEGVQSHYDAHIRPNGTLIGVAGNVDPHEVRDCVGKCFEDWQPKPEPVIERTPHRAGYEHLQHDAAQTHIGLAFPAVPYGDPAYYAAWAAVSILSGGSSARLFTEVRENRGLCYSIYATLHSVRGDGRVLAYAGTTNDRAQETLDVMLAEIERLPQGIEAEELERCRARAKSALIMQQESAASRAGSVARDWFYLNRVNTLDDIHRELDSLSADRILEYLDAHPLADLTLLTVGPEALSMPKVS